MGSAFQNLSFLVGVLIFLAASCATVIFASTTATSQSISCEVSPDSDWESYERPEDYLSVEQPGEGLGTFFGFGGDSNLMPLDKSLSTEWSDGSWEDFPGIRINNGSATSIAFVMEPGKRYTFCIDLSGKGDIYLIADSDYWLYESERDCSEDDDCFPELLEEIPLEWRDLGTWIPFRDTHAYESISYQEFSVALDSDGSTWSFAGFGGSSTQTFYLVLDNWDNSRPGDQVPSGNMSAEVIIDVEERVTLPKITAYFLVGALPISCIILPLLLHWRYHSAALEVEDEVLVEVPFLDKEKT